MLGEDGGGLVACAQVARARRGLAETTEVDGSLNPLVTRHPGERARGAPLALHEVALAAAAHRVDEVVRDVDVSARSGERGRVEDVALVELGAELGQVLCPAPVSHETANARTLRKEPAGESTADEAGGSCDECVRFAQNGKRR